MRFPDVSFGLDVRHPSQLVPRSTDQILRGVVEGEWRPAVELVRSLPPDSAEQRKAKLDLPYATWAGVFRTRRNADLVRHSGQVGIDLDHLGESKAVEVIQTAVADVHCLCAFRSVRGEGVRLLFRVSPIPPDAKGHETAFEEVAQHVRNRYGVDPDKSGRDVARASFVSFDRGLWLNPSALPIRLNATQRLYYKNRCVGAPVYAGQLALTCWDWFGRTYAWHLTRDDGTARTHTSLLEMGKSVALHAERIGEPLTPQIEGLVFDSWLAEHHKQGSSLRCAADEYRREFELSVRGAPRKPWFPAAAHKWTRWARHSDYPSSGNAIEKLLFAIRHHCAETGSPEFWLGSRDAALILRIHYTTAAALLRRLVTLGYLEKGAVPKCKRHAQTYKLRRP